MPKSPRRLAKHQRLAFFFGPALSPGLKGSLFHRLLGTAWQTPLFEIESRGCAVLDRLGGFVFAVYLLLIGCACFAIVSAFTFAVRLPGQSLKGPAQVSRAEAELRSRDRTANWLPPEAARLVPPAPQTSVSELTKGLEEAEGNSPAMRKPHVVRPRVAGWVRREKPSPRYRVFNETTSRIILRSLFARN